VQSLDFEDSLSRNRLLTAKSGFDWPEKLHFQFGITRIRFDKSFSFDVRLLAVDTVFSATVFNYDISFIRHGVFSGSAMTAFLEALRIGCNLIPFAYISAQVYVRYCSYRLGFGCTGHHRKNY